VGGQHLRINSAKIDMIRKLDLEQRRTHCGALAA
jgi:hypothetical protein